jgi:hypothetical protein
MPVMQQEAVGWDELFAVVENRLRGDSERLSPPTAVLRLKAAIAATANAEICLSALQDLRAALGSEVAARRALSVRCDALQAALREVQGDGNQDGPGLTALLPPDNRRLAR